MDCTKETTMKLKMEPLEYKNNITPRIYNVFVVGRQRTYSFIRNA